MPEKQTISYNGWKIWRNSFRWQAKHKKTQEWLSFGDTPLEQIKTVLDDPARREAQHRERLELLASIPTEIAQFQLHSHLRQTKRAGEELKKVSAKRDQNIRQIPQQARDAVKES